MSCVICLEVIILNKPLQSLDHIHAHHELKQKTLINVLDGKKSKYHPPKGKWALLALTLCIFISIPFLYLFNASSTSNADRSNDIEAIVDVYKRQPSVLTI